MEKLPCDDLVQKRLLLSAGFGQVDPGRLDALMSENVSKESDIAVPFQKVFRKPVTERMRIHSIGIDSVADREMFEAGMDPSDRHGAAVLIEKEKTAGLSTLMAPGDRLVTERVGNINTADLSAFRVEIQITAVEVLDLDLGQFADTRACGYEKTHDKIPEHLTVFPESLLKKFTVLIGNNGVLKGAVRNLNGIQAEVITFRVFAFMVFFKKCEIAVQCMDPLIDRGGAIVLDQKTPVCLQIDRSQLLIESIVVSDGDKISSHGVFGLIFLFQVFFKLAQELFLRRRFFADVLFHIFQPFPVFEISLPVYNFIKDLLLFGAAPVEIDPGRFNTFMAQDVGQHGDIVTSLDKIPGEQMSEGVRMDHRSLQTVACCELF